MTRSEVLNNTNVSIVIDGDTGRALLPSGQTFIFDACNLDIVLSRKWYYVRNRKSGTGYILDSHLNRFHHFILNCPEGYEIDHVNMDTLDNRLCNLRICSHQQNQCNQGLQSNNTSGVSGVSFYRRRNKYRARIKVSQHDIHLGYYQTFQEAVQARNVGMECMFGEFAQYNDVPDAPDSIRNFVVDKCKRFYHLSLNQRFFDNVA